LRRVTFAVALAVAVIAAALVVLTDRTTGDGRALNGVPPKSFEFAYFADLRGLDTVTYGTVAIPNPDRKPLKVLRVAPNAAHFSLIGVVAVLPAEQEEHGIYHGGRGWPATAEVPVTRPAIETQLQPKDFEHTRAFPRTELQLLIGLRTDGAELAAINGVEVEYILGKNRVTRFFPGAMLACSGSLDGSCSKRDAETDLRSFGLLK